MRVIWLTVGILAFGLAILGVILPLLPTVPFLLLSAFGFARSSPRLHSWLVTHPRLGPPISDWQSKGAIRRKAKYFATGSIAVTFVISFALHAPWHVIAVQSLALSAVLIFIWSRPEH